MGEARRIDGAIAARKQAGPDCERRVEQALAALAARRQPITLQAVLQQAGVSRSFIYSRPQLRAKIPAGGPRRATAREAARDYDLPRVASLQARLQQTNAELLAVRKQPRATERALAAAGGPDTRLANDSELEECKGEVGRLSVELTAAHDHAAHVESLLADKEADYQAARENARGYLKELTILRGELAEARRQLAHRPTVNEIAGR